MTNSPDPRAIDSGLQRACQTWADDIAQSQHLQADQRSQAIQSARTAWTAAVEIAIAECDHPHTGPEQFRMYLVQDDSVDPARPPAFYQALGMVGGWARYLVDRDGIAHNTACYLLDEIRPTAQLEWRLDLTDVPVDEATQMLGHLCHVCHGGQDLAQTAKSREWHLDN